MDLRINRRQIFLLIIDAFLIALSFYLAFLLRFEFYIPPEQFRRFEQLVIGVTAISLLVFYAFGLYRRLWRYASVDELNTVVIAVTFSSAYTKD